MKEISVSVSMANLYAEEDVKVFLRSTLRANSESKRWLQNLLCEVETTLSTGARGMYVAAYIP